MADGAPLQNRVTPAGDIVAVPERGTLTGNRGVLHDEAGRIRRPWQVRRWIACALEFRGRHREPMPPGRWTALFFVDEATALAAGHRPCAECRHADYRRFRAAWAEGQGAAEPRADEIDRVLHAERLDGRRKRLHPARLGDLPDGVIVEIEGGFYLTQGDRLLGWWFSGYKGAPLVLDPATGVDVLTPPSIVAAIRAGYEPAIHPSAREV
jgi:hypothetical protein